MRLCLLINAQRDICEAPSHFRLLVGSNSKFWECNVYMQCRSHDEMKACRVLSGMDVWKCSLQSFYS